MQRVRRGVAVGIGLLLAAACGGRASWSDRAPQSSSSAGDAGGSAGGRIDVGSGAAPASGGSASGAAPFGGAGGFVDVFDASVGPAGGGTAGSGSGNAARVDPELTDAGLDDAGFAGWGCSQMSLSIDCVSIEGPTPACALYTNLATLTCSTDADCARPLIPSCCCRNPRYRFYSPFCVGGSCFPPLPS